MEDGGVDALAKRLGIGSRHLRRLFLQHLGAPPLKVVQTRRLHFVKKMIDETSLPMLQVALAGGFGSVRRFNAMIRRAYDRTPTQIRNLAPNLKTEPENEYVFRLHFRSPFDWDGMLDFLALRAIPGVEVVEGKSYRRTVSLNGFRGCIEVSLGKPAGCLSVRICFPDPRWLFLIVERVRQMFDLNADPLEISGQLTKDPLLAKQVSMRPGLRVPGCWDGFELAVRAVLGQQVTVKRARTLAGRLVQKYGTAVRANNGLTHLFPSPEILAASNLASIGVPGSRAATIRSFARAVLDGGLSFTDVGDVDAFLIRFQKVPGIGDWMARYIAMRAFGDPDAFPSSDLGLLQASSVRNPAEMEIRSRVWRPWRAYAAMYLWQQLHAKESKKKNQLLMDRRPQNEKNGHPAAYESSQLLGD